ncbi:MAG: DUF853 family protein [Clostridia bacterium]|nr:DUF853 family protein [Clostridia bacterium]
MLLDGTIWLGTASDEPVCLTPEMANRHGLIAGATGTGKTVTLQVLAEGFSQLGVPVFLADVKGDLAGLCIAGEGSKKIDERLEKCGVERFSFASCPVTFWDVYGQLGHPIRTTVSEMGPLLLSRMLGLNDTQTGVMHILFRIADDEGMLLLDLKDVKAMLAYVGENAGQYTLNYGHIAKATVGAIQRAVAMLEDQGGKDFFGEPAFDLNDFLSQDENGQGMVNILAAEKLFRRPAMYSTFLLWLLGELYECLPEQGDKALPRMVFFFDEAHLLFDNCSKALLERIEQTVRLIRSKGVGVYFVTQSPTDVPSSVLGQLSGRVQHALRAFTPQEQKIVRAVAQTFRVNPAFDTEAALSQLSTGEALLSFLQGDGSPAVVQRATILPPQSRIGAISDALRKTLLDTDLIGEKYDALFDRESAYEILAARMGQAATPPQEEPAEPIVTPPAPAPAPQIVTATFRVYNPETGEYEERPIPTLQTIIPAAPNAKPEFVQAPAQETSVPVPDAVVIPHVERPQKPAKKKSEMTAAEQMIDSFAKSAVSSAGRELGRTLSRSLLGILGIKTTRRTNRRR